MPFAPKPAETPVNRREFVGLASVVAIGALGSSRSSLLPLDSRESASAEVTKTAESIHEEVTINASRARVYAALTDATKFSAMTAFSMVPKARPAKIAREVGGAFDLFDGHIVGRHVELVPDQRIVQAWRAADWPEGVYSIARFELKGQGAQTTIVFDHTGFPVGQGEHLDQGWDANYWTPLRKLMG